MLEKQRLAICSFSASGATQKRGTKARFGYPGKVGAHSKMNGRTKLKVKWFDNKRGFGFLITKSGDAFIHYSSICGRGFKTLHEGQEVCCELVTTAKGLRAINVSA